MARKRELTVSPEDSGENLSGEQVTEHIWRCPDGMYRWYFELSMLKNPVILFTAWKVLGISFGVVYLFVLIASAVSDSMYGWKGFFDLTWGFILLTLVIGVIAIFAYLIVAWCYGWKYVVLFEMDDKIVRHIQVPRQFKKAQALAWLSILAGIAAQRPAVSGAGLLSMTRNTSTSEFKNVERIVIRPKRDLIKVNQIFNRNQIYAAPGDFEFVRDHIVARCGKARIR